MPRNWDDHYSKPAGLDFTPSPLLVEVADLLPPGHALDIACGPGRHALYLAHLGWRVTAVDSSPAAIRLLRERSSCAAVDSRVADLTAGEFRIPPDSFDLICDFYYLQRDLFPQIRDGIRPGGVFAGAIHLLDEGVPGPHTAAFQLQPGELRRQFADWKILFYSEACEPGTPRPAARIIARRA